MSQALPPSGNCLCNGWFNFRGSLIEFGPPVFCWFNWDILFRQHTRTYFLRAKWKSLSYFVVVVSKVSSIGSKKHAASSCRSTKRVQEHPRLLTCKNQSCRQISTNDSIVWNNGTNVVNFPNEWRFHRRWHIYKRWISIFWLPRKPLLKERIFFYQKQRVKVWLNVWWNKKQGKR